MKKIYANNLTTLSLGRQGENLARQVVFDIRDLESLYGSGTVEVIHQRPGDAQPYPLAVQRDGTLVTWDVTATDTEMSAATANERYGKCELRYYAGETLAKSQIWRTWVESAMDTPSEAAPPEPEQGWVDQVLAVGVSVKEATDSVKTYSNSAEQSASGAAQSAQEAAGSASAASTSATNAKASEVSAKEAQKAATESANAAANSAELASEYASAASESASAAAASKTAAKSSEEAAKASETAAKASETTAAESASAAQQSATSAAESAAVYDNVVTDITQLKQDVAAITPDDTTVDGKPWTSKKIVDSLCQHFEENGNPVQVYPIEAYPLGVKVSWEPVQEGSGDPSPENVRPITGRNSVTITHSNDAVSNDYNIALTETVYGGEVDAVTGDGKETWKLMTFDGTEGWNYDQRGFFMHILSQKARNATVPLCDRYTGKKVATAEGLYTEDQYLVVGLSVCGYSTVSEWKAYLAAQYAAGTPVQICYKPAEPLPFTVIGAQPIPALSGVNTIYTDANGVVVTGAEDPKHTITELKNAIISLGGNV